VISIKKSAKIKKIKIFKKIKISPDHPLSKKNPPTAAFNQQRSQAGELNAPHDSRISPYLRNIS